MNGSTSQDKASKEKESKGKGKKKSEQEKQKIVELNGEYGVMRSDQFCSLSNFVLKCEGIVIKNEDTFGFMVRAKPKNNREGAEAEWLESVFLTRRDMSDQYTIVNKLGSSRLWITSSKDFLPGWLKSMCDAYEKSTNCRKLIPVEVLGLQPYSEPPVWVLSKTAQLTLEEGKVRKLDIAESPYAMIGEDHSSYHYEGELDDGDSLRKLLLNQEQFFGPDTPAALLIIGGAAMSFHYELLSSMIRGVPVTMAIGEPVSGKSSAVEVAMSLFNVRECVGAGSEAKLFESLGNTTIPAWWDDIDSIVILERLTVLLYNRATKVTMGRDTTGSTLPIITTNYSKLAKGLQKLKTGATDASRLFTRLLTIPFAKKGSGTQGLKERLLGRAEFATLIKDSPKSIGVILKLHKDFSEMPSDPLFHEIENHLKPLELDVRSEENFASLMFATGKILQHIDLFTNYWDDLVQFVKTTMYEKYKLLLSGDWNALCESEFLTKTETAANAAKTLENALTKIVTKAKSNPDQAQEYIKFNLNTKGCDCGNVLAFNVPKAVKHAGLELTGSSLRFLIRARNVGCVNKKLRLDTGNVVTCAHVSRRKMSEQGFDSTLAAISSKLSNDCATETSGNDDLQHGNENEVVETLLKIEEPELYLSDTDKRKLDKSVQEHQEISGTSKKNKNKETIRSENLYDSLHPGAIEGKRIRIARKR